MPDLVQRIATKALIVNNQGKVLLLREASTYADGTEIDKYGIPGGRIGIGEAFEAGLHREVREETGLTITIGQPLYVGEWRPTIRGVPHQIVAIFFVCTTEAPEEAVRLSDEHDHYIWIRPADYVKYSGITEPHVEVLKTYAAVSAR